MLFVFNTHNDEDQKWGQKPTFRLMNTEIDARWHRLPPLH